MARSKAKEVETAPEPEPAKEGFASKVEKKVYTPDPNPFDFVTVNAPKNRVQLLKSQTPEQRKHGDGAWVIRFAINPNETAGLNGETYSKEHPHPALQYLKAEGYKWGFDEDGKGGWGKRFSNDPFRRDFDEAKEVLKTVAEMIGQPLDMGKSR